MDEESRGYHLLDWLSFTVPAPMDSFGKPHWIQPSNYVVCMRQALARVYGAIGEIAMEAVFGNIGEKPEAGRFPFRYCIVDEYTAARCYYDVSQTNILVELPGRACTALAAITDPTRLVAIVADRCTRIDISMDLPCDATPQEFANAGYSGKFGTYITVSSTSGESVYVGSRKSDRQAAIYRYSDPHPRSTLLRVEHRFRRKRAKQMAVYLAEHGLALGVEMCKTVFGWESELWPKSTEPPAMDPLVGDRRESRALYWVTSQVIPALRRYERQGIIVDLRAFLNEYLHDLDESGELEDQPLIGPLTFHLDKPL